MGTAAKDTQSSKTHRKQRRLATKIEALEKQLERLELKPGGGPSDSVSSSSDSDHNTSSPDESSVNEELCAAKINNS